MKGSYPEHVESRYWGNTNENGEHSRTLFCSTCNFVMALDPQDTIEQEHATHLDLYGRDHQVAEVRFGESPRWLTHSNGSNGSTAVADPSSQ